MDTEDVIPLFNRLVRAVQSKVPMWLVMVEMTQDEVAALECFLSRCEEMGGTCKELWREGESEKQRILCELIKEAHRRR